MSKHVVTCDWDQAPHLSESAKAELMASIPEFQRDARSKGVPQLGSGAVFQVPESDIRVADFAIPDHWLKAFAMDAGGGAKPTAATWGAKDPDTHVTYVYSTHKATASAPAIHAEAIKGRGIWIPGVGDCAALIMTDNDAEQLIEVYRRLGLNLILADKGVETGIYDVWQALGAGLLKVFASCGAWFEEYRLYRRDDKGRIVKSNDHLMDCTRYLVRSGMRRAIVKPITKPEPATSQPAPYVGGHGWMG